MTSKKEVKGLFEYYYSIDDDSKVLNLRYSNVPENYTGIAKTYEQIIFYENGICHRLDGPAIYNRGGYVSYFIYDQEYNKKEFWKHPLTSTHKLEEILKL